MRIITILLSVLVGIALCLVFLNNPHQVQLNYTKMLEGQGFSAFRYMPLWQIVFGSVGVGAILGWLLGVTGRWTTSKGHQGSSSGTVRKDQGDVDYLLGVRQDKRH